MSFEQALSAATRAIRQQDLAPAAATPDRNGNYKEIMTTIGRAAPHTIATNADSTTATDNNPADTQSADDVSATMTRQILASAAFLASVSS